MWFIYKMIGAFSLVLIMMNVNAKPIYGLYEKVQLPEIKNVTVKAKLDSGALTSSLGASDIHFFEKDAEEWVRFKPQAHDLDLPEIEKKVVRHSRIKRRSGDISDDDEVLHTRRPVVLMEICFDGVKYLTEVNLADRSRFNYPLLLGSASLREFKILIDPELKFQSKKECN